LRSRRDARRQLVGYDEVCDAAFIDATVGRGNLDCMPTSDVERLKFPESESQRTSLAGGTHPRSPDVGKSSETRREGPPGHATRTIVGTSTLAPSGIVAGMLPMRGSRSAGRRSTRTAVRSARTLAMGVEVSDRSGDRRRLEPLAAAGRVWSERASRRVGVDRCLTHCPRDLRWIRMAPPDRPSLRVSGCALLRDPAHRTREFGGNALPCGFLPRSLWCGYLAVADARGRARA
jgi:hypothetical protein